MAEEPPEEPQETQEPGDPEEEGMEEDNEEDDDDEDFEPEPKPKPKPEPKPKPKSKPKPKPITKPLPPLQIKNYLEGTREIPMAHIRIDKDLNKGQVRQLNEDTIEDRTKDLEAVSPLGLLSTLVWPDPDGFYYLIGGQHVVTAAKRMGELRGLQNLPLKAWQKTILGHVVKRDTPLETRERLAGQHQRMQHAIKKSVTSVRCGNVLVEFSRDPEQKYSISYHLDAALEKIGTTAAEGPRSKLVSQWLPLGRVLQVGGAPVAQAIARMESRGLVVLPSHFKQCEGLTEQNIMKVYYLPPSCLCPITLLCRIGDN